MGNELYDFKSSKFQVNGCATFPEKSQVDLPCQDEKSLLQILPRIFPLKTAFFLLFRNAFFIKNYYVCFSSFLFQEGKMR